MVAQAFPQNAVELVQDVGQSSLMIHLKVQLYNKRQFVIEHEAQHELKKALHVGHIWVMEPQ